MQHLIYFFALVILTSGLFIMLISDNYVRKIVGLGVFQSSVLIFYLSLGKVNGGVAPIDREPTIIQQDSSLLNESQNLTYQSTSYYYSSPVPHVLMLTSIVVSFATLSVGLAFIYRIAQQFGTISESKIHSNNNALNDFD